MLRFAGVQDAILVGGEMFDAMASCAKIVHQDNVFEVQFAGEDSGVHGPGKIGGADAIVDDWTGDSETRSANFFFAEMRSGLERELANDQIKLCEILASKTLRENRSEFSVFFRKKRQVALCAANVASKNHRVPPSRCLTASPFWQKVMD